jgi:catalase
VVVVDRSLPSTRSIEYDAVVIAGGTAGARDIKLTILLQEAFRHCKVLAAWGDGEQVLLDAGIDTGAPGILIAEKATAAFAKDLLTAVGLHRVWERAALVMAS